MDLLLSRLRTEPRTRIVAFGSSNTERRIHGLHWFDWLDLAIKQSYGRVHHCINAGLGGDTTRGLLQRFDRDVALYQPHAVLVTIGGNDSNPGSGIHDREFATSLRQIEDRIRTLGATVIFQTYYSADVDAMTPEHGSAFLRFMDLVREMAGVTGAYLVDHHRRWERLRKDDIALYRRLMLDPLHVNPVGNMVLGLDLARHFQARLQEPQLACCTGGSDREQDARFCSQLQGAQRLCCGAGVRVQQILDALEAASPPSL
jgi:lysophospholipase L1-like esterase